ncbi:glycoside hydrolase family 108 protein [Paracoccaceae bacterium GXU_MW_L88]
MSTKPAASSAKTKQAPAPDTSKAKNAATTKATVAAAKPNLAALAIQLVMRDTIEGGYVNDPRDPGGETNHGISKRAYPKLNIRDLTKDDAIAIYKRDYWDAINGDELAEISREVALAAFDGAVNQGVEISAMLLQKAVGAKSDGIIGPKSLAAVRAMVDAEASGKLPPEEGALIQFLSWRLRRYAFTRNSATFMRGWSKRVLAIQYYALMTPAFSGAAKQEAA